MDHESPFSVLTLIAAPAVLTNASSLLTLGTSNRLARAVDRARDLTNQLEKETDHHSPAAVFRARELSMVQRRMAMLIRALQAFYLAVGSFASAALISLIGALVSPYLASSLGIAIQVIAGLAGLLAVGALGRGSLLLVAETRVAVIAIQERIAQVQDKLKGAEKNQAGIHLPGGEGY